MHDYKGVVAGNYAVNLRNNHDTASDRADASTIHLPQAGATQLWPTNNCSNFD